MKSYLIQLPSTCKISSLVAWDERKRDYLHVAINASEATELKDLTKKVSKSLARKIIVYAVEDTIP
jgi:hypothetical protein